MNTLDLDTSHGIIVAYDKQSMWGRVLIEGVYHDFHQSSYRRVPQVKDPIVGTHVEVVFSSIGTIFEVRE